MKQMERTPIRIPFRPSTGRSRRSRPLRWITVALLAGIACCSQGGGDLANLQAGTQTDRVRIFLIDREEGGILGRRAGCADSAVPVEVKLPRPSPALEGALNALLGKKGDRYDSASGYYNALYASPLEVERIERHGPEARVRLRGYLELGETCDGERALAQLQETALQFSDVQQVHFYLGDQPLAQALAGR